jgi:pilus assembly protein CpaE
MSRTVAELHTSPQVRERPRGKVVAVYSPKGGVGSTTVATNLAVALAARPKTSVALIDLDLQFGDVGAALDLRGANSVAEIVNEVELTSELIDETFVRHSSGVRVLLAPEDLSVVESIDPDHVVRLLSQLRQYFDFVIADLWSSFESLTTSILRASDRTILVTTPELPSIRNVQRILRAGRADFHLEEKAIVVANRYPGKTGLSLADMNKALGLPIAATIPSEGATVTEAINRGLSLLDSRARVRLAKQYHQLAAIVADSVTSGASVELRTAGMKGVTR